MLPKTLMLSTVLLGAATGSAPALALEAQPVPPPSTGARPTPAPLIQQLQPPPLDAAATAQLWRRVLDRHPEIATGPQRSGSYVVLLVTKPDGQVVRDTIQYAANAAELSNANASLTSSFTEGTGTVLRGTRGNTLAGAGPLTADVMVHHRVVPADWDESRSLELVRRAVMQDHGNLALPPGGYMYLLTVVMNEQGGIAREKIELLEGDGSGVTGPVRSDFNSFMDLGLPSQNVGVTGLLRVSLFDPQPAGAAAPAVGPDGILRGVTLPVSRGVMVRYAWPRRPGEPVGGAQTLRAATPMAMVPAPQAAAFNDMSRIARQYFPEGGPSSGNWMVMSASGEVLRTGHVELAADERLTNAYIERLIPGIRIASSTALAMMGSIPRGALPAQRVPGERFTLPPIQATTVHIFVLEPGATLP